MKCPHCGYVFDPDEEEGTLKKPLPSTSGTTVGYG